jgi:hypothetical protein
MDFLPPNKSIPIGKFMLDIIQTKTNAGLCLQELFNCDCCERHQINKPLNLDDFQWKNNVPAYRVADSPEIIIPNHGCRCRCRHLARIIQDSFNPRSYRFSCKICHQLRFDINKISNLCSHCKIN